MALQPRTIRYNTSVIAKDARFCVAHLFVSQPRHCASQFASRKTKRCCRLSSYQAKRSSQTFGDLRAVFAVEFSGWLIIAQGYPCHDVLLILNDEREKNYVHTDIQCVGSQGHLPETPLTPLPHRFGPIRCFLSRDRRGPRLMVQMPLSCRLYSLVGASSLVGDRSGIIDHTVYNKDQTQPQTLAFVMMRRKRPLSSLFIKTARVMSARWMISPWVVGGTGGGSGAGSEGSFPSPSDPTSSWRCFPFLAPPPSLLAL
jgi:hypothetical protein